VDDGVRSRWKIELRRETSRETTQFTVRILQRALSPPPSLSLEWEWRLRFKRDTQQRIRNMIPRWISGAVICSKIEFICIRKHLFTQASKNFCRMSPDSRDFVRILRRDSPLS